MENHADENIVILVSWHAERRGGEWQQIADSRCK
jgi:hypothetical protein